MAERDSVRLASQLSVDLLTFTFDLLASDLKTDRRVTRGVTAKLHPNLELRAGTGQTERQA